MARRPRRAFLRRGSGDREEYRCTNCLTWKSPSQFHRKESGPNQTCVECVREQQRRRRAERMQEIRAQQRDRYRRYQRLIEAGDAEAARLPLDPLTDGPHGRKVPVPYVRAWIEEVMATLPEGDWNNQRIAEAVDLHERRVRRIRNDVRYLRCSYDTAERVAMAAGRQEDLERLIGEPGLLDWSPHGHRFCERCGTWVHPHYARGYCRRCYVSVRRAERAGRPVTRPLKERWAYRHDHCRECKTTRVPHRGRGLCCNCYEWWSRAATKQGLTIAFLLDALHPVDFPASQTTHLHSPSWKGRHGGP